MRPFTPHTRAGALALAALALFAAPALGSPAGDIDPSFDFDGKRVLPNPYMASEVLVQADGKLLVVGNGASNDFAVTRLNTDGSIDRGYGGNGTAVADFGETDKALAAAIQPDGRVVVAGSSASPMGDRTAVARFDTGGKLDATFDPGGSDGDGKKLLTQGPGDPGAVLVQPDGRIVVAGSHSTGGEIDTEMAVTRLTPTGEDDGTEWDTGRFAARTYARDAALSPDGTIVVAGEMIAGDAPREIALARFGAGGKLDKTLGGTGKVTHATDASEEVGDVLVQPDGKVVVIGSRSKSGFFEGVVTRFNRDGTPDRSWGRAAQAFAGFESQSFLMAGALQPDGKVVVAGLDASEVDMAAARFRSDGSLDPTFGSGGRSRVPGGFIEAALAVALQPDGRVVMAGQSATGSPVVRLLADPPPSGGSGPGDGPADPPKVLRCAGKAATIVGTARSETLRGTPRADVIVALGGSDRVVAGRGRDVVCGGSGRDVLLGGPGSDRLIGGGQRDRCAGGPGRDRGAGCEARRSL